MNRSERKGEGRVTPVPNLAPVYNQKVDQAWFSLLVFHIIVEVSHHGCTLTIEEDQVLHEMSERRQTCNDEMYEDV